jgi:hypothetical protein
VRPEEGEEHRGEDGGSLGTTVSAGAEGNFAHSIGFSGKGYHRSSKASRREDLQVEEPVACGDGASFDFHPTLAGMLSPTLIGDQVIEGRQLGL